MDAGRLLVRVTVAPALLVVAWLAVSLPLLMADVFRPLPAVALFVPVAAVALWFGLRTRADGESTDVPWWPVVAVLGITVAFLVLQIVMSAEQIVVRRDPASYVQFTTWLKNEGSLPIPLMDGAFGGSDPALRFESPAFYERDGAVVPQFMAGLPLVLTLGGWIGGTHGILLMAPLLGACCVLAFAGLVARLVSPRWAPAGALLLALTLPMLYVSRSAFSELPAIVLLLGGLSLMYDVRAETGRLADAKAFLAGLALGLIVLVRIDGLRDVLPVLVFAGLYVAFRRRVGYWTAGGLLLGAGAGLLEGYTLSRPYLTYLGASLDPLLAIAAVVVAATLIMVVLLRWDRTGSRLRRLGATVARGRLPGVAAVLTVLVMVGFAVRPWVQTVRREPATRDDEMNVRFIETIQRIQRLPVDGTRQYSEDSLHWVSWYIGPPALLFATVGAALLVRRLLRGRSTEWLLPYAMIVWTTTQVLIRPGITPDHPWASRRLIGLVIPGLLLFTVFAAAWAARRVRLLGYGRRLVRAGAVVGVALMLVPIVLVSGGLLVTRTEQHEVAAVDGMCDALDPRGSVVVVEQSTADRFLQVVRGMCGVPSARTTGSATIADVRRVIAGITEAGRHPVIMAARPEQVAPYGTPRRVLSLRTRQDGRTLTGPPGGTWGLSMEVWIAEPPRR
ncbi:hypothetical protein BZB76_1715 [Actinomadura pelletieri DSM 43383]|uniref:4-amino-4-deoxy-L-arabinose transferase-like glycosyltransferase n=1 Tax=Actinomadura pelletieri DSM 43383 TaxID=1120940 RepID=A0A495QSI7_9ACTN|nr:hypothetical protein [Actinomadura pelletieri]RKS76361.1 hypothetical protein BZB76_1715 [Actinomadura pelletieri DSM 43383]